MKHGGLPFAKGADSRRKHDAETNAKRAESVKKFHEEKWKNTPWDELPLGRKRKRVLDEQDGKCICGLAEWLGGYIMLELHHHDGNTKNNARDNLFYLCPNCHSQTDTFKNKKRI